VRDLRADAASRSSGRAGVARDPALPEALRRFLALTVEDFGEVPADEALVDRAVILRFLDQLVEGHAVPAADLDGLAARVDLLAEGLRGGFAACPVRERAGADPEVTGERRDGRGLVGVEQVAVEVRQVVLRVDDGQDRLDAPLDLAVPDTAELLEPVETLRDALLGG
jgi:hypothetical protein